MKRLGVLLAGAFLAGGLSPAAAQVPAVKGDPMTQENLLKVCQIYLDIPEMSKRTAMVAGMSPAQVDAYQRSTLQSAMLLRGVPLERYQMVDLLCAFYMHGSSDMTDYVLKLQRVPATPTK